MGFVEAMVGIGVKIGSGIGGKLFNEDWVEYFSPLQLPGSQAIEEFRQHCRCHSSELKGSGSGFRLGLMAQSLD